MNIKATINKLQKALIQRGKDGKMRIADKIKRELAPHYLIIGHYTGEVIGCTCGDSGKKEVLAEEPLSKFRRVSKRKCPVCEEFGK